MRTFSTLAAAASLAGSATAEAIMGFNSGSTTDGYKVKLQEDFEQEFSVAANLEGAPGNFNSVRLYTMVQGGTTNDPLSAFPAAIKYNTSMLLGIWCSGTDTIENDLTAMGKAIEQYGTDFTDLVVGISVGSEDLYRNSVTGVSNKAGIGANPDVLVGFIQEVRKAIEGTPLANVPVGHVDTWDVWGNSSNKAVVDNIDFLGTDAYPYYQNNKGDNSIKNAKKLWDEAIDAAVAAGGGKPVWITETGWPTSGPAWGNAQSGHEEAKQYWDDVGCTLFGKVNTWWYTLRDSNPVNEAKFALTPNLSTTPFFDLTCPPEETKSNATSSASASGPSSTGSSTSGGSSPATGAEGSSSSSSASASADSGASLVGPQSFLAAVILAAAAVFAL